ncbi:EAL domain-containing protein [Schinkia azotoformans]|uniref:EAL domain-containing protein n=1 Tax=Schinkia azotoformans TaxID=1454 RepID=UPI002E20FC88|nr:EAL domain-containing protein [Schinkia azotoformans]
MTFYSVFQPIWDLKTNIIHGHEALLRGNAPPEDLFKRASETNKLVELDSLAHTLALTTFCGEGRLFLNLHPKTLEKGFKIDLSEFNIDPTKVVIEITEHEILNESTAKKNIKDIKNIGIKIAVDDFGHGFTNLSLIEWTQPNYIKLDRSLIKDIHSKTLHPLLRGLNQIAANIGSELVAEGIETKEQLDFVKYCGIKFGQGFLLGRPKQMKEIKITG